jgi:cell division protease FtsH
VAELVPHGEPVSKISIVPHSRGALGYTMQMPTEDRYLLSIDELKDRIAVMLGGRAAEMVQFETISTGASDDIMRATELTRRMVTEFGMSEKLGSVRYAGQQLQYLGGPVEDNSQISQETRQVIDTEVRRLVTEQYERAQGLLKNHRAALNTLAQQLLKQETVSGIVVKEALQQSPGSPGDGETVVRTALPDRKSGVHRATAGAGLHADVADSASTPGEPDISGGSGRAGV